MKILPSLSAALLACTATTALAQGDGFDRADVNRDGMIDNTEMSAAGGHAFQAWDGDGDGRITAAEFSRGLHGAWSGDKNRLRRQAFSEGWRTWFESDPPRFAEVDGDGNGAVSVRELRAALADARMNGPWQGIGDDGLTPDQFRQGLASVGDRDRSGGIDRAESGAIIAVIAVEPARDGSTDAADNSRRKADVQRQADAQRQTDAQRQQAMQRADGARDQQATGERRATGSPATTPVGEVVTLREWNTSASAGEGWSARAFFDTSVRGPSGEEIGDVEDLIVGSNGELLSLVAEVGGFWDIGDTHVSIPWDAVTIRQNGSVVIPVTEDNVDDYGFFGEMPTRGEIAGNVVSGLDDQALGARAWRVSELIGDLARVRGGTGAAGMGTGERSANGTMATATDGDRASGQGAGVNVAGTPTRTGSGSGPSAGSPGVAGDRPAAGMAADREMGPDGRRDGYQGYGYVRDVIFADGHIAAVVVDRAAGRTVPRGSYAYPFYGYGYGWTPGQRYYDMPYTGQEADQAEPFAYGERERS